MISRHASWLLLPRITSWCELWNITVTSVQQKEWVHGGVAQGVNIKSMEKWGDQSRSSFVSEGNTEGNREEGDVHESSFDSAESDGSIENQICKGGCQQQESMHEAVERGVTTKSVEEESDPPTYSFLSAGNTECSGKEGDVSDSSFDSEESHGPIEKRRSIGGCQLADNLADVHINSDESEESGDESNGTAYKGNVQQEGNSYEQRAIVPLPSEYDLQLIDWDRYYTTGELVKKGESTGTILPVVAPQNNVTSQSVTHTASSGPIAEQSMQVGWKKKVSSYM